MISSRLPHIFYGGDYTPEQWPEEVWQEDVRLMGEAGVNIVSLGIFAWARLEPKPGKYEFGWLDRIMTLLSDHGISVDLATATASPPPWLAALHPDSLPVTAEGTVLWPGGRQQYCPSNEAYRGAARALVQRLANRYRDHPALVMWHSNNEYGCHVPACFCDRSAEHFRQWLQQRYETIGVLNDAWGTAFWSQGYDNWSEINPPRSAPTFINPTQQLDFKRFSSDALLECFEQERAVLKEVTPDVPVTTNFMGFFKPLDYWKWASREDVVSTDTYPDPADPHAAVDAAMGYDLIRSLGGGSPWVLMEQATSQVNWRPQNVLKRPGQMRLWSYQAVARGANGVMFFQWRASKAGAEKFHGALVPHVGTEKSRIWNEVTQLGRELAGLDVLLQTRVQAEVAIVFDWESWWGLELNGKPSSDLSLLKQVSLYYGALHGQNISVDFVQPDADLTSYKVLLVPNLYLVRAGVPENFQRFVQNGGHLVMSFFSGIVDAADHILLGGYPAPFRHLLGIRVEEFDPYVPGQTNEIVTTEGRHVCCTSWSDLIDLEGAATVATFAHDFYAGRPAITRNAHGDGSAYYLGTNPDEAYLATLLAQICAEAQVRAPLEVPAEVEVIRRTSGSDGFLFLLNHGVEPAEVHLETERRDLLTGMHHTESITLPPHGVSILHECLAPT